MTDRLPAGDFTAWVTEIRGALRGERDADVPCAECTACCRSSQFVHIGPDEIDTLAHVPAELLFPAPRQPRGHVLMGYDDRGHCPMLVDDRCSIYEHRPRTCRTYDCRVFSAAGVPVDANKPAIAGRVTRWHFGHPTEFDRIQHDAVTAAADYLDRHRAELPDGTVPTNATQRAVFAVEVHDMFVTDHEPEIAAVHVELTRRVTARDTLTPRVRPRRQSGRRSAPRAASRPDTPADRGDRA